MKLYYSTGTCAMACVAAVEELGLDVKLVEVSWKKNQNVDELDRLNPLGMVPVLQLDNGKVLTQNVAILEYFADKKGGDKQIGPAGSLERGEVVSWLSFVAAELQRAFTPGFRAEEISGDKKAQEDVQNFSRKSVENYLKHIDHALEGKDFIVGSSFSVADCYLFVITGWAEWIDIDLSKYKALSAYRKKMSERPGMKRMLAKEDA